MPLSRRVQHAALYGMRGPAPPQFPNAATTGYAPGTQFTTIGPGGVTSGNGWTISGSGASAFVSLTGSGSSPSSPLVFEKYYVPYNISIKANNVLVRNCWIQANPASDAINIHNISGSGSTAVPSTNITIQNNTISSQNPVYAAGPPPAVPPLNTAWTLNTCIRDANGNALNTQILNNDLSNATTCAQLQAGGLIQGNYIHDMNFIVGPGQPHVSHINGITSNGVTSTWYSPAQLQLNIIGNTVLNPYTQSDAISLFQDNGQEIYRTISGNLVAGGGYMITGGYGGSLSVQPNPQYIVITNNAFWTVYSANGGQNGWADGWRADPVLNVGNVWSGNYDYLTGAPVQPTAFQ